MTGLTRIVQPTEVHITLDGIAPIAKIQQQRKRRYLSVLRQTLLKKMSLWDTNAISPGTGFMQKLNKTFREQIARTFSAIPFHFHGSDQPGEGEHKIFQIMETTTGSQHQNQVIYGLDADLIMLSLLSHKPHLYLMREYQERNTVAKKAFGGRPNNRPDKQAPAAAPGTAGTAAITEEFHYLDIDALRVGILKTLQKDFHWPISNATIEDVFGNDACLILENYVVACFLLGNDFIPNIGCLHLKKNGLYSVLSTFREAWEATGIPLIPQLGFSEVSACPFSQEFLSIWLERLAKNEDAWFREMNDAYFKKRAMIQGEEDKVEFYPIMPEHKAKLSFEIYKLNGEAAKWRPLYYKYLFDAERQDRTIGTYACREYLKGMLWTYAYYKRQPKPFDWYYPYGYAPTLLDMFYQLSGDMSLLTTTWNAWQRLTPMETECTISSPVQLMAILPKHSHGLLPEDLQRALRKPSTGIAHLFPDTYPIETYLKTHLWECHPKLPILDFGALRRVAASVAGAATDKSE
jgi:5'-3' exonuclease